MLTVSTKTYNSDTLLFDSLYKGQGISFEANILGLGNEYKMHHLHAKSVTKIQTFNNIDDIIVRESALPWWMKL